jgi:hypothetical protein
LFEFIENTLKSSIDGIQFTYDEKNPIMIINYHHNTYEYSFDYINSKLIEKHNGNLTIYSFYCIDRKNLYQNNKQLYYDNFLYFFIHFINDDFFEINNDTLLIDMITKDHKNYTNFNINKIDDIVKFHIGNLCSNFRYLFNYGDEDFNDKLMIISFYRFYLSYIWMSDKVKTDENLLYCDTNMYNDDMYNISIGTFYNFIKIERFKKNNFFVKNYMYNYEYITSLVNFVNKYIHILANNNINLYFRTV